ncbi:MAG: cob(I)yrinic acid a,c-diamide adenosyltransferase [Pseudomonadota bacterium]
MVVLNKIYTKTGDAGTTALGTGERRAKHDPRISAYGTIDEANATIGVARLTLEAGGDETVAPMLKRIQNDLFDLGADLCTPDTGEDLGYEPLRIVDAQVARIEEDIDALNAALEPLRSFVLPGGSPAAAQLHVARTVARRGERLMTELVAEDGEQVSDAAMKYVNRLSDFLFVASRYVNDAKHGGSGDELWVPGANR